MTKTVYIQVATPNRPGTAMLWSDPSTIAQEGIPLTRLSDGMCAFQTTVDQGLYDCQLLWLSDNVPFLSGSVLIDSDEGEFDVCTSREEALLKAKNG